jgi:hypothetical protein
MSVFFRHYRVYSESIVPVLVFFGNGIIKTRIVM